MTKKCRKYIHIYTLKKKKKEKEKRRKEMPAEKRQRVVRI